MEPVVASRVRYIKLGTGGAWEERCKSDGRTHTSRAESRLRNRTRKKGLFGALFHARASRFWRAARGLSRRSSCLHFCHRTGRRVGAPGRAAEATPRRDGRTDSHFDCDRLHIVLIGERASRDPRRAKHPTRDAAVAAVRSLCAQRLAACAPHSRQRRGRNRRRRATESHRLAPA